MVMDVDEFIVDEVLHVISRVCGARIAAGFAERSRSLCEHLRFGLKSPRFVRCTEGMGNGERHCFGDFVLSAEERVQLRRIIEIR